MFDEKGITQTQPSVNPNEELGKINKYVINSRKNFDEAFIAFAYYYIKQLGIRKTDLVIKLRLLMLSAKSDNPSSTSNFNMEDYRTDWLKILNNVKLKKQKYKEAVLTFVKEYFEEKQRDDVEQNMYYINKEFFESYYNKYHDKYDDNTLTRNVLIGCVPFYKDGKYIPTINSDVKIKSGLRLESARMLLGVGLPNYDPTNDTSTNQGENKNTVTADERNEKNGGKTRRRQKRKSKRKSTKRRTKRKLRRKNTKK